MFVRRTLFISTVAQYHLNAIQMQAYPKAIGSEEAVAAMRYLIAKQTNREFLTGGRNSIQEN